MNRMTSLGLNIRLERVLAYAFGWVSGIIFFFCEKNRNVRWHAAQSMVTFGSLSILMLAVSMLRNFLAWILYHRLDNNCWPDVAPDYPGLGIRHPVGMVDHHGHCARRLPAANRQ